MPHLEIAIVHRVPRQSDWADTERLVAFGNVRVLEEWIDWITEKDQELIKEVYVALNDRLYPNFPEGQAGLIRLDQTRDFVKTLMVLLGRIRAVAQTSV